MGCSILHVPVKIKNNEVQKKYDGTTADYSHKGRSYCASLVG